MGVTRKAIFLFAIILVTAGFGRAETAESTHVFPHVVDGVASDGTSYTSRFVIASSGEPAATCQVALFGMGPERLSAPTRFTVQGSSVETIPTRGQDVIHSGYARLDCSRPVVASLTYTRLSANGTPLGIATVPSAPAASAALIPMVLNGRNHYGIAVANDNEVSQLVVFLFDCDDGTSLVRTVQLEPKSQYVLFADQIFNLPATGLGTLRLGAVSGIGADFLHMTALLFDPSGFTNVVPLVFH
jgi:hypothetical protein